MTSPLAVVTSTWPSEILPQGNGSTQRFHVDVSVADEMRVHGSGGAFENEVPLEVLSRERSCRRAQDHAGVRRNQHLVIDVVGFGAGGNL